MFLHVCSRCTHASHYGVVDEFFDQASRVLGIGDIERVTDRIKNLMPAGPHCMIMMGGRQNRWRIRVVLDSEDLRYNGMAGSVA